MPKSNLIALQDWKSTYGIQDYQSVQTGLAEARKVVPAGQKMRTMTVEEKKVVDRSAFYFIVNVADGKKCVASLTRLSKEQLTYCDKTYHSFTPLHVAVLLDNIQAVNLLLGQDNSRGEAKDEKGFTPFHFSAFVGGEVYKAFTTYFRPEAYRTPQNGTVQQLRDLIGNDIETKYLESTFWQNSLGELVPMTPEKYLELTGKRYTSKVVIEKQSLLWEKSKIDFSKIEFITFNTPAGFAYHCYLKFQQSTPKILVKKCDEFSAGDENFGLFAADNIEAGTAVREYTGVLRLDDSYIANKVPEEARTHYWLGGVDAFREGCGPELANDGFPNARFGPVDDMDGQSEKNFLCTLRPIKKGEAILVDYGITHPTKFLFVYHLPDAQIQEMEHFFRENTVKSLLNAYMHNSFTEQVYYAVPFEKQVDLNQFVEFKHRTACVSYLVNTPWAVIHLAFSKIIDVDELVAQMQTPEFEYLIRKWFMNESVTFDKYERIILLCKNISILLKYMHKEDSSAQKEMQQHFLNVIKELKVFQVRKLIFEMTKKAPIIFMYPGRSLKIFKGIFDNLKERYRAITWDEYKSSLGIKKGI